MLECAAIVQFAELDDWPEGGGKSKSAKGKVKVKAPFWVGQIAGVGGGKITHTQCLSLSLSLSVFVGLAKVRVWPVRGEQRAAGQQRAADEH